MDVGIYGFVRNQPRRVGKRRYFKNEEKVCFGSALANLFVELGDRRTARQVYERFPRHELVSQSRGITGVTSTKLVRDLTGRRI